MPYADYEQTKARARWRYQQNKQYHLDKAKQWHADNPKRSAYLGQRHTCNQRDIEFNLTFDQWVDFWGTDFSRRGRKMQDLCMCRYGDKGAYEVGNIYKATNAENKCGPREKDEGLHEDIPY